MLEKSHLDSGVQIYQVWYLVDMQIFVATVDVIVWKSTIKQLRVLHHSFIWWANIEATHSFKVAFCNCPATQLFNLSSS